MPTLTIFTSLSSPYQVEFWDAVAAAGRVHPRVVYAARTSKDRSWTVPVPQHDHVYLTDPGGAEVSLKWTAECDLYICGCYHLPPAAESMADRAAREKPWVYWGERPGFSRVGFLGRLRRRWRLSTLYKTSAPIWGIGRWAIEGWRREFGESRRYYNLPYFSDLARFTLPAPATPQHRSGCRFLYSGSLIRRKGVDLLPEAFREVRRRYPDARLHILGAGRLERQLRRELPPQPGSVEYHGFADWADLPGFYRAADVSLVPSRHDGWGLVVPEALAAGLPVIATDTTGAAHDLLRNGVNGWVIKPGSRTALANAMLEAAGLPPDALAERKAAAVGSVSGHQLSDGVRTLAAVVRSTLGEWGRPPK